MLKATHKGRATTLSKTLLTAGMLGGAALSSLGAGSAQAACLPGDTVSLTWAQWTGDGTTATPLTCRDKIFTWVSTGNLGDLGASTVSAAMPLDGDYIFNLDKPFTADPFDFTYDATITPQAIADGWVFSKIDLDSDADTFADPPSVLTATYDPNVGPDMILTSTNGSASIKPVPLGPTIIRVNNKYMPPNGGAIDTLQNSFQQDVPAPLPLLGVGAVLGSIRKLRKFSSQLKTFSMG
jgi:hypothetical protein